MGSAASAVIIMLKRPGCALIICLVAALAVGCSSTETKKKRFFNQAEQALEKKQYKEAILAYRNAIKIDPRFGDARYKLAQVYGAGDTVNSARECTFERLSSSRTTSMRTSKLRILPCRQAIRSGSHPRATHRRD